MRLRPPLPAGFADGARAILPLLPATATVGVAVGVAGPKAGLTPLESLVMSAVVYFPSVILAALELFRAGVPLPVVVLTALVVGARVAVLSLSIAPYFRRFSAPWRALLAYFLWTPVYALTVERFRDDPDADPRGYYLGLAVPIWLTLQAAVGVGVAVSRTVPDALELGFIVPLAFVALLARFLTDRAAVLAAAVSGVVAVAAGGVPLGLGVVVATAVGTVAGALAAGRGEHA